MAKKINNAKFESTHSLDTEQDPIFIDDKCKCGLTFRTTWQLHKHVLAFTKLEFKIYKRRKADENL